MVSSYMVNSLTHVSGHEKSCVWASQMLKTESRRSSNHHGVSLNLPATLTGLLHLNMGGASSHKSTASNKSEHPLPHHSHTPSSSPKEDISSMWRELHGADDWAGKLDPLHPWLRREILKYGEFAQATYDAFDFDTFSEYCGSCRYNKRKLFEVLGLGRNGYDVTKYLYAMSHVELPRWLERSIHADAWSQDSNWMGYVAVSGDEETKRIGRRDIVVAWRGTVSPTEWLEDLQAKTEKIEGDVKVEHGFLHIYKSKCKSTWCNKASAQEQATTEVKKLVNVYKQRGEEVSITVTGHSLGGALAILTAHDAATIVPDVPVSVVSFGAPMVGNAAFREKLDRLGVKVLRVASKQDAVPRLPGVHPYVHVGVELSLEVSDSPFLKKKFDLVGFHGLETYLHLVDGYVKKEAEYRKEARRDLALVNKCSGMLKEELGVPECWFMPENKGMVRDANGRWVVKKRAPEDIPSPLIEKYNTNGVPSPLRENYATMAAGNPTSTSPCYG